MERVYRHRTHPFLKGLKVVGLVILGTLAMGIFAFLFGYFVMLLWNWLMPAIFNITAISFWQAVGIVILARLIFGGFKHGGHSNHKKDGYHKKKFFDHWVKKERGERKFKDWKYFEDFWFDEGEQSYNDYIERRKEQDQR